MTLPQDDLTTDGQTQDNEDIQDSTSENQNVEDNSSNNQQDPADATSGEDNTNQQDGGDDVENELQKYRAMAGKMQQEQQRANELQKRLDNVVSWIYQDPNRLEQALVNTAGYTPEQAKQEADALRSQQRSEGITQQQVQGNAPVLNQQQQQQQQNYQGYSPQVQTQDQIAQQVQRQNPQLTPEQIRQQVAEETRRQQRVMQLYNEIPQLDEEFISKQPEDKQAQLVQDAQATAALASVYKQNGMDGMEAAKKAYKVVTGKTDEEIEKAKTQGRLQGIAETQQNAEQVSANASSQVGGSQSKVKLTPEQRKAAQNLGMTAEDYQKYGSPEGRRANI